MVWQVFRGRALGYFLNGANKRQEDYCDSYSFPCITWEAMRVRRHWAMRRGSVAATAGRILSVAQKLQK